MKTPSILLALLFSLVTASSCAQAPAAPIKGTRTIPDELGFKGFNTLKAAVRSAGLKEMLDSKDEYTFVAPIDTAFRDLPKTQLDALMADKEKLKAVLLNHIIKGKVGSADFMKGEQTSVGGLKLEGKTVDGKIQINSAKIVKPDIEVANGVILGIDKLFLP
jgi:uncharacterized surface protein with fasciclin (FAS1) repeats